MRGGEVKGGNNSTLRKRGKKSRREDQGTNVTAQSGAKARSAEEAQRRSRHDHKQHNQEPK